jgi:hypothetical protein
MTLTVHCSVHNVKNELIFIIMEESECNNENEALNKFRIHRTPFIQARLLCNFKTMYKVLLFG